MHYFPKRTWRVNQLFNVVNSSRRRRSRWSSSGVGGGGASSNSSGAFEHVKVSEYDVLVPFTVLMSCNVIVLLAWTLLDPLIYTREEYEGTDYWNRVIATYGFCRARNEFDDRPTTTTTTTSSKSDRVSSVLYYLIPLILLNTCVLFLACYQAFQAKDIQSEFAESKYIGLTLSSILQTFLTGIPIVFVVRDMPEAFYVVTTFMIFILCMVVLLFIFVPKMYKQYIFNKLSEQEQRAMIQRSIHSTTRKLNATGGGSPSSARFIGGSCNHQSSNNFVNNNTPSGALSDTSGTVHQRQRHVSDKSKSINSSETSQHEQQKNNGSSIADSVGGDGADATTTSRGQEEEEEEESCQQRALDELDSNDGNNETTTVITATVALAKNPSSQEEPRDIDEKQ